MPAKTTKDDAGNFYIAGSIPRTDQQPAFAVLKYNPEGRLAWAAHYNGSQGGVRGSAISVSVDSMGNVFAVGFVQPELVTYSFDLLVVKFNSDGVEQWAKRILNGRGLRIIAEPSGNVYATGAAESIFGDDWLTIKFATDGTMLWERRVNTISTSQPSTLDRPVDMALDAEGNVIVTGKTQILGIGSPFDITTVKYDSNGNELFSATFSNLPQNNDLPFDMDVDPAGNIWVNGIIETDIFGSFVPLILKYAPSGQLLLTIRDDAAGGFSVDTDPFGDVFVAGLAAAAKFDRNGIKVWEQPLTFPAVRILADSRGNVYVSGSQQRFGTISGDYMTTKFSPKGHQLFQHGYNGAGNDHDVVSDILFDNSGNLLVVGSSTIDSSSYEDIVTLKFLGAGEQTPQSLGTPSGLSAVADSRQQISIRWQDNASSEDGFRIERCQGSNCADFTQIAEVGASVTRFVDAGLSRNTFYSYRVRAFNAGGNSEFSNIARVRTPRR